jgi:hypothetical protein
LAASGTGLTRDRMNKRKQDFRAEAVAAI